MKKTLFTIVVLCGLVGAGLVGTTWASSAVGGDEPAMMASPSTIVLAKVSTLTVHTNIPASTVEPGSFALNGAAPTGVGVDSCGDIVGKFAVADLGLAPGTATLTLTGAFADGGTFTATDVVTVK